MSSEEPRDPASPDAAANDGSGRIPAPWERTAPASSGDLPPMTVESVPDPSSPATGEPATIQRATYPAEAPAAPAASSPPVQPAPAPSRPIQSAPRPSGPQQSGPQQSSPQQSGPQQPGPQQSAPPKSAPQQTAPQQPGPRQTRPPQAPAQRGPAPSGPAPSGTAPTGAPAGSAPQHSARPGPAQPAAAGPGPTSSSGPLPTQPPSRPAPKQAAPTQAASSQAASSQAASNQGGAPQPGNARPRGPALAYSEVPAEESTVAINPVPASRPETARTTAYSANRGESSGQRTEKPGSGTPAAAVARRPGPTRTGSTLRNTPAPGPLSISAVVGFALSALGFLLLPLPFGLWLGYRGVNETTNNARDGRTFAKWAVYLGWAWVVFWVLALITYLWILL